MRTPRLPSGLRAAGIACGLRGEEQPERLDLGLLVADQARPAAAVFTRSKLLGAHIPLCREHLDASGGLVRAVVVNAGNANCCTGSLGEEDAREVVRLVARGLDVPEHEVLFMSTGVIGARLPMQRLTPALPALVDRLGEDGLADFADAILTTDTRRKVTERELSGGARVVGVAKGSGMIHPDLATMFGFLLTDAALESADEATRLLRDSCRVTFNRLSVDGDTSPNDTVLLWSTGATAVPASVLATGLTGVGTDLCRAIAADGEGASRLVTLRVAGAASEEEATHVGRVLATSPLCKTAITGRDPNWGRFISAACRAGVEVDPARMRLSIGGSAVFRDGEPLVAGEAEAHRVLREQEEVVVELELGRGEAEATVWSCDLTAAYVSINADYRT